MALLRDYIKRKAEKTRDIGAQVVTGCRSRPEFISFKAEVDILEVLVNKLKALIVPLNMRNNTINKDIKGGKMAVVAQLEIVRKKASDVCNGDASLENSTGFTSSTGARIATTHADPVILVSASATGTTSYLLLKIKKTIPRNIGYEVHYILDGKDYIACMAKVKGRSKTILAGNFPSGVKVEVYLITLATNNVRSIPSNRVFGLAL